MAVCTDSRLVHIPVADLDDLYIGVKVLITYGLATDNKVTVCGGISDVVRNVPVWLLNLDGTRTRAGEATVVYMAGRRVYLFGDHDAHIVTQAPHEQ